MDVKRIDACTVFNSQGEKTVEAVINNKYSASASCGTSKGRHEAKDVPAERAIKNFMKIKKTFLKNLSQKEFDALLKNNMHLFGSTMSTALSLAFFSSSAPKNTFPRLLGNVIGGGAHAKTLMEIQEILVMPNTKTVEEAVEMNFRIWKDIGSRLETKTLTYESAWSPDIRNEDALKIARRAADEYSVKLGVDMAASQLYKNGKYIYNDRKLSRKEQIRTVERMAEEFELSYIEDPLEEDDFEGFGILKRDLKKTLICGDDLTTTNMKRLERAIKNNSIGAIIIKPNQAGTVTDCLEIIKKVKGEKIVPVVSHRSGATDNNALAKLALNAPLAKLGVAGIRIINLNELLRMWRNAENPVMSAI